VLGALHRLGVRERRTVERGGHDAATLHFAFSDETVAAQCLM
jgi:hypothetical protein